MPKKKLAVVVSHPIQYYAPFYRALHRDGTVEIMVFFCSRVGLDATYDEKMGVNVAWAMDLIGDYPNKFLPESQNIKDANTRSVDNPSIKKFLNDYNPDIILLHGYNHITSRRVIWWAWRNRVPLLNISDRSLFGRSTPLRRFARSLVLPLILRRFAAILVLSDEVQRFYTHHGMPERACFRVPNMLDDQFWRSREKREALRSEARTELGIDDLTFAFIAVGKFITLKRFGDVIEALTRLTKRRPERKFALLLIGDGPLRAEFEAAAAKLGAPVHFLGFQNINTLPKYYCAADAFVHASENESYGIVALEAALYGLPLVLSSRMGAVGPSSIGRPDENALIFKSGDITALTAAMERVATDSALAGSMSQKSLTYSKDHDGIVSVKNTLAAIDYATGSER